MGRYEKIVRIRHEVHAHNLRHGFLGKQRDQRGCYCDDKSGNNSGMHTLTVS